MSLKSKILKILKEETSFQTKIKNLLDTQGVFKTSNVLGGLDQLVSVLDLDLNDESTRDMLVINFIKHIKGLNVISVNLNINHVGSKILTVELEDPQIDYTGPYETAISQTINHFFPFQVQPSGHPVFKRFDYYIKVKFSEEL